VTAKKNASPARNFKRTALANVPNGRNGKHKVFVEKLLSDLRQLDGDNALRIPLAELPHSKANVRSALNRATRKLGITVATAVDESHLYVWNAKK
jgi:hypothetical protein